jgi:hypothetical protein
MYVINVDYLLQKKKIQKIKIFGYVYNVILIVV